MNGWNSTRLEAAAPVDLPPARPAQVREAEQMIRTLLKPERHVRYRWRLRRS
jgi:hypothetical protein